MGKNANIIIVDYGMGNLGSVENMLKYLGYDSIISERPSDLEKAEKLILSGVGAFDNGIKNLRERGLWDVLCDKVLNKKTPVLGICLGMQLFTRRSEEGQLPGLGWINAQTVRFRFENQDQSLKVPHMGWNIVNLKKPSKLFREAKGEIRFYFVHSYHLKCADPTDILCETRHGYDFTSAVERENIYGVQFHPEKSHKFGINLLKNFLLD